MRDLDGALLTWNGIGLCHTIDILGEDDREATTYSASAWLRRHQKGNLLRHVELDVAGKELRVREGGSRQEVRHIPVEHPRPGVVRKKSNHGVLTPFASVHNVSSNWVLKVVGLALCSFDNAEGVLAADE